VCVSRVSERARDSERVRERARDVCVCVCARALMCVCVYCAGMVGYASKIYEQQGMKGLWGGAVPIMCKQVRQCFVECVLCRVCRVCSVERCRMCSLYESY
jgi:hypothetical protein